MIPYPPNVVCLFFNGLLVLGDPDGESDPLLRLGGTFGGTITELTFIFSEDENSGIDCSEVFDAEATTSDFTWNGFQALPLSAVLASSGAV